MKKPANKKSWKTEPFGEVLEIPYTAFFSSEEFEKLKIGLVPEVMEDKWFIYFNNNELRYYRSWTGFPVFKVLLKSVGNDYAVNSASASKQTIDSWGEDYSAAILNFLTSNLLLGKSEPFPKRTDVKEQLPGMMQHGLSGSGYKEIPYKIKKSWWKIWK